ncbi:tRNA-dihydrouridine synthase [Marinobacterium sp. CAU 1594]|nr:tRNA-dihydrouridine synthase [Marinobacterium arenosum]
MEGVVDPPMRELLSGLGGIDLCVTEFVRVSDRVLPAKVFHRLSPELANGGRTRHGTPVLLQLLGSDPQVMAGNARKAAKLGAPGIDLNFGCPAKTVNKNRGGAVLLQQPDEVYRIVEAVRAAVPAEVPVTAKMRLGYADKSLALDNARAIEAGGADGLAVHARTKVEGYRPPAHWEWIARIRNEVSLPVTANGEVWNYDDYLRCREVSGCQDVMIGRGLIARPDLALQIKREQQGEASPPLSWRQICQLLLDYLALVEVSAPGYVHGRIKQWLHMMKRSYPQVETLFLTLKTLKEPQAVRNALQQAIG